MLLPALLEVNTIEQEYVFVVSRSDLSHRRDRSRVAAGVQMGSDYRRMASPDVAEWSRGPGGSLSCVRGLPDEEEQLERSDYSRRD